MYTNHELFKLIMNGLGFGDNTNFNKLKQYITVLHEGEVLDLEATANDLAIDIRTLQLWNERLPLIVTETKVKKNMSGKINLWLADDIEDWLDNYKKIVDKFKKQHMANAPIESRVTFANDSNGDKADYCFSHWAEYTEWLAKNNKLELHTIEARFFNGAENPRAYTFFREWSLRSFGIGNEYTKKTYRLDNSKFDLNFFKLLKDETMQFIITHLDNPLTNEEKEEFIKLMNIKRNGKLIKSIDTINQALADKGYEVQKITVNRKVKWQITDICR